ncbi:glutamate receptor ionotropic, kainate 2-like [Haliotis asinina]|uniref:glutamate receptor ionotropic, kainate 2-like n=1 Tax=Haliotis asinina TaxID=109174 RepID=UPI0035320BFF
MAAADEVDLVGIPFGATLERKRVVTFSSNIGADKIQVAYRKTAYTNEWLFLLKCYSLEVYLWGLVGFIWVVIFYTNLELSYWKRHSMKFTPAKLDVIQTPLAVALNQGAPHLPASSSGRVLLGSWRILCLIVIAIYTGNQTAFSAVKKDHVPFSNMQELAENNEYKIVMTKSIYLEAILQTSNDSVLKKIWSRILESRRPDLDFAAEELQWHTDLLLSGKYAFIEYETIFDAISANSSNVARMKHSIVSVLLQYPFPLHSPLAELFSSKLTVLYENGVIQEMLKKYKPKEKLETSDNTGQTQFSFSNMKAAVVTCSVSIGISCVMLTVECVLKKSIISRKLSR